MITRDFQVTATLFAVEIEDAITLLPLMDELVSKINNYQDAIDKFTAKEEETCKASYYVNEAYQELPTLIKRYNVLRRIGFVSSFPLLDTVNTLV